MADTSRTKRTGVGDGGRGARRLPPVRSAGPAPAAPAEEDRTESLEARVTRYARENLRLTQRIEELHATDESRRQALGCAIQAAAGRRIRWGKLAVRVTQAAAEFERYLAAGR